MIKHNIAYNSQRDNINFGGKFPGFWQCFTTCAWMLMSFYSDKYVATDDEGLSNYLDDIEVTAGKTGIGEKIKHKYKWITGHTSEWWLTQQAGIEEYLWRAGVKGNAVFRDMTASFDELRSLLDGGPVIIGTSKLGGLPGGHIILAIGYNSEGIICHDPYGNAVTGYRSAAGGGVLYGDAYLRNFTGEKIRCMYWR